MNRRQYRRQAANRVPETQHLCGFYNLPCHKLGIAVSVLYWLFMAYAYSTHYQAGVIPPSDAFVMGFIPMIITAIPTAIAAIMATRLGRALLVFIGYGLMGFGLFVVTFWPIAIIFFPLEVIVLLFGVPIFLIWLCRRTIEAYHWKPALKLTKPLKE
jgi:hypothetical protein